MHCTHFIINNKYFLYFRIIISYLLVVMFAVVDESHHRCFLPQKPLFDYLLNLLMKYRDLGFLHLLLNFFYCLKLSNWMLPSLHFVQMSLKRKKINVIPYVGIVRVSILPKEFRIRIHIFNRNVPLLIVELLAKLSW